MYDKYRKKFRGPVGTERLRRQIAVEAARRLLDSAPEAPSADAGWVADRTEAELYAAKRKAAAVLGHRVRPGDLPSDGEVREEAARLGRSRARVEGAADATTPDDEEPVEEGGEAEPPDGFEPPSLSERLDRFTVYRIRLAPLESIKLDPREHPEGDAIYHSLQVYELAREARPYDEEFLLAALLHEVGRAIDPRGSANAAVDSLRGAVTERTLRLIANLDEACAGRDLGDDDLDDLALLRELDRRGRRAGAAVGSVEDAVEYVRGLERESYLES
ncbi:phosphohydrolase [Aquisphaera insulae]|uniref:phosphohydrolase n=1 Tax=Aquisphaera insulae TaxID=2712864 RepID=UPI0013ED509B|nr:phosphohydrolase [Aquisphaera insulae]